MKIQEVLKKLTIDEKISLLEGKDNWQTANIDRLNVPSIFLSDGPHGLRKEVRSDLSISESIKAVVYPTESTISQSFDESLVKNVASSIAKECIKNDVDVLLAPGINIKRHPLCGRNFEYYSEDPYISGMLAKAFNEGLEEYGIGSCLKHYCCNNQEKYRMSIDSVVDQRTLHEIYLKAFSLAITKNTQMVMASYNKINSDYSTNSKYLLKDILRDKLSFKGIVVSDWMATVDRTKALKAGLDLEMPTTHGHNLAKVKQDYLEGRLTTEDIDNSVLNILNIVNKHEKKPNIKIEDDYLETNHKIAIEASKRSIILAKNENSILPLDYYDRVLFVGELFEKPRIQGRGSSQINPYKIETIDCFKDYLKNNKYGFNYLKGYNINGVKDDKLIEEVVNACPNYEKVVLIVGQSERVESEGYDRDTISLDDNQIKLIKEIAKVNKNLIVVVNNGSVIDLSFNYLCKALLISGLGGEGYLEGLRQVLYGKHNPYARLTETYASKVSDYPSDSNFGKFDNAIYYSETINIGYRYFQTYDKKVIYPFGHGLSYSEIIVDSLKVSTKQFSKTKKIKCKVNVTNKSNKPTSYILQVYVGCNDNEILSKVSLPLRQLARFIKVDLQSKETKTVEFELNNNDFSFYNTQIDDFYTLDGTYLIEICENASSVLLKETVTKISKDDNSYNEIVKLVPNLSDSDFSKLFDKPLPNRYKPKHQTITVESTLDDYKKTFLGKIIFKIALKKISQNEELKANDWVYDFFMKSHGDICLRNIPHYTNYAIDYGMLDGIIDIMNNHFIKGIKKIKSKTSKPKI